MTFSPNLGRFLEADPIEFEGGDTNLYRFVGNNPVNLVDPSGLQGTAPTPPPYQLQPQPNSWYQTLTGPPQSPSSITSFGPNSPSLTMNNVANSLLSGQPSVPLTDLLTTGWTGQSQRLTGDPLVDPSFWHLNNQIGYGTLINPGLTLQGTADYYFRPGGSASGEPVLGAHIQYGLGGGNTGILVKITPAFTQYQGWGSWSCETGWSGNNGFHLGASGTGPRGNSFFVSLTSAGGLTVAGSNAISTPIGPFQWYSSGTVNGQGVNLVGGVVWQPPGGVVLGVGLGQSPSGALLNFYNNVPGAALPPGITPAQRGGAHVILGFPF